MSQSSLRQCLLGGSTVATQGHNNTANTMAPLKSPIACQWCNSSDVLSLRKCARCRSVYYCSKEHQKKHWKVHKLSCSASAATVSNGVVPESKQPDGNRTAEVQTVSTALDMKDTRIVADLDAVDVQCANRVSDPAPSSRNDLKVLSTWSSKTTTSQCLRLRPDAPARVEDARGCGVHATSKPAVKSIPWLQKICQNVVSDMNSYGICVLDNFLGAERGDAILGEVLGMYERGVFTEGQLVNSKVKGPSRAIRGDRIAWVHGTEPTCPNVGFLVQTLDSVITTCTKMKSGGLLGRVKIHRHTKAMIACYPGNGTHYVKHVDNPHGDGRCVTSIYYLNKHWEKKHAGRLRIFPANSENQVAEIEPIFDRIVFFWSDRRNPHEVEPSYAVRFAITVWYFDDDERNNALKRYQQEVKKPEL